MTIDGAFDIARDHFERNYRSRNKEITVIRHYAKSELRLFGRNLDLLLDRYRVKKNLVAIADRRTFYYWYYINYVKGSIKLYRPPIKRFPTRYLLQAPEVTQAMLLLRGDLCAGIVNFQVYEENYTLAIEECANAFFNAVDSRLVTIDLIADYDYRFVFLVTHFDQRSHLEKLEGRVLSVY